MNEDKRYYLDEKDAAIVFHEDMSFEMVLPKVGDEDMISSNSNTFFVIALALAMRKPEFMQIVDDQRAMMQRQMDEGCSAGPTCGGCPGGCHEEEDM